MSLMQDQIEALRQAIAEAEKQPVHAVDMSQERVDETAKREHEWVGLTDEERGMVVNANFGIGVWEMARAIEAKLREKNGG